MSCDAYVADVCKGSVTSCSMDLPDVGVLEAAIGAFGEEAFWPTLLPFICDEAAAKSRAASRGTNRGAG